MLNIKPLRPTSREKKRYLVYQIDFVKSEGKLNNKNMFDYQKLLIKKIQELLGVFQTAGAGIIPVKISDEARKGILRVNNKYVDLVRSCFVMITNLEHEEVIVRTIGVSGILKKAQEKYFSN